MKPEPLKNKNKIIQKEIIDLLIEYKVRSGVVTKVIAKLCKIETNRKLAVEWLKERIQKLEDTSAYLRDDRTNLRVEYINDEIDKAFEDVVKGE